MKKLLFLLPILFILGCNNKPLQEVAVQENYYLSNDETACAFIFYDVEGAAPLKIENRIINYHFNENNILTTNSPYDFGWKSAEEGGFREVNYYKQDGTKIEKIANTANGGIELNGTTYNFSVLNLSEERCFSTDKDENETQLSNLIKEIYKIK